MHTKTYDDDDEDDEDKLERFLALCRHIIMTMTPQAVHIKLSQRKIKWESFFGNYSKRMSNYVYVLIYFE